MGEGEAQGAQKVDYAVRLRERRKLAWAVAVGFMSSALLMVFTLGVVTGALTTGAALAVAVAVITLFVAFMLMDIVWEGWGIQLFSVITVIIVMLLMLNIIFGRQVMP
ncbi:MAG: hypothetical protein F7B17_09450 [Desulfurococcales archaeon]|nr:hypothetical protein [Desulfurococcales archaeon]